MTSATTVPAGKKVIDVISQDNGDQPFISLEYFPPRTDDGVKVCNACGCMFVMHACIRCE